MSAPDSSARGSLRRLSLTTVDQAISGASNVLAGILAARLLGPADFGFFGIVFLTYSLVLGVARSLVSAPLLIDPDHSGSDTSRTFGAAILVAAGGGVLVAAGGAVVAIWVPRLGLALIVMALLLPALSVQDVGRYTAFAQSRPMNAIRLDLTWLVLLAATSALALVPDLRNLPAFVGAWAGAGALAGLQAWWVHCRAPVSLRLDWLRRTWSFGWRNSVSFTTAQAVLLAASASLSALAGPVALAAARGAALVLTPFTTFITAGAASSVADIARIDDRHEVRRRALLISLVGGLVGLANGAVLFVLPDVLGRLVLGETWSATAGLALVATVDSVLTGLALGPLAALQGLRAIDAATVLSLVTSAVLLVLALTGAGLGGLNGYYWAVAFAHGVQAVIWWTVLWRGRFSTRSISPSVPEEAR